MNAVVGTFTHTFTHMPLAPAVHTNFLRQSNRLTLFKTCMATLQAFDLKQTMSRAVLSHMVPSKIDACVYYRVCRQETALFAVPLPEPLQLVWRCLL